MTHIKNTYTINTDMYNDTYQKHIYNKSTYVSNTHKLINIYVKIKCMKTHINNTHTINLHMLETNILIIQICI